MEEKELEKQYESYKKSFHWELIKEKIMTDDKKNGVVVKDDHNEFELMLRFFGNEILAIKLAASNFNGKLIMWSIVIMLFTFMLMEVFGFSAWLGIT